MNVFSLPTVNGTIVVTTTSQAIALQGAGGCVVVKNLGGTECFIAAGASTVTAVAAAASPLTDATDGSFSIPAGEVGTYSIPITATHLAAVTAAGTTLLRVSRGEGA